MSSPHIDLVYVVECNHTRQLSSSTTICDIRAGQSVVSTALKIPLLSTDVSQLSTYGALTSILGIRNANLRPRDNRALLVRKERSTAQFCNRPSSIDTYIVLEKCPADCPLYRRSEEPSSLDQVRLPTESIIALELRRR